MAFTAVTMLAMILTAQQFKLDTGLREAAAVQITVMLSAVLVIAPPARLRVRLSELPHRAHAAVRGFRHGGKETPLEPSAHSANG
ncbi:hypothetical protein [Nocardia sp. NPDC057030]|uniref:hypothetical protein n=1 Tax=unclassified Nocardia TaxID=2637762 RepID=UPI003631697B